MKIVVIKPSGVVDRTTADSSLTINDNLWSDSTVDWSDSNIMWSVSQFSNNAISPQISLSKFRPGGIVDRTNAVPLTTDLSENDVLWSDTDKSWSDSTVKWGIQRSVYNAIAPKMSIERMKPQMLKVQYESSIQGGATLYAGMPMGLLLALTYPTTT